MKIRTNYYPLLRFRSRLFPWSTRWDAIPDGKICTTQDGILIRVKVDAMYRGIYYFGDYEGYNTKIYKRLIGKGEAVFDIGANFGWFSSHFAKWTGPEGHVHAFEPVPFIHEYTKDAIALNHLEDRVSLNFMGLGRSPGEFTVYSFKGLPHGHATATDLGRDDATPHRCKIGTLDDYCEEKGITECSFLKIDVEGHEEEVFAGGKKFLSSSSAPIIAFEINTDCLKDRGITPDTVFDTLRECGYDNFYSFEVKHGVRQLINKSVDVSTDCLAFKSARKDRAMYGLKAGRLWR